jgi:N6-adenosine-specific RNA methylase IME4
MAYRVVTQAAVGPVAPLAADDAAVLFWSPLPILPEALAVIEAWGFKYKAIAFNWVKHYTRGNAEFCLLATRGSPKRLTIPHALRP